MPALDDDDRRRIAAYLHELIVGLVPEASTASKYGGTLYTIRPDDKEGQFCGVFPYTEHVQLSFTEGALLPDPSGMLSGGGKYRRHVNFVAPGHADDPDVANLIRAAAAR